MLFAAEAEGTASVTSRPTAQTAADDLAAIQPERSVEVRIEPGLSVLGRDDLLRQLQLAIKLKSKISVVLDLGGGKQVTYLIEPVGLANGRLRAKDRKADVERTLPISSIVSIELL